MESPERVADLYFTVDFPALLAIARWELGEPTQSILRPEALAETLGRTNDEAMASIGRLFRGGYIEAYPLGLDQTDYYLVKRLTSAGLREVGAWPNATDLADAFKKVIQREANEADKAEPEKGRKLHQLLDVAEDLGTSVVAKVAAELIKAATNLP